MNEQILEAWMHFGKDDRLIGEAMPAAKIFVESALMLLQYDDIDQGSSRCIDGSAF